MATGGRNPANKYVIDQPSGAVSFDPEAFNEYLNAHGVRLVHWKALRCPVGMTDIDDNNRPHDDHSGCSNGFIYYKVGVVTAAMQSNGNSPRHGDMGIFEDSTLTVTFPQTYDCSDVQFTVAPFDRFFLDETERDAQVLTETWHLQKAHQSRLDKLYYPAVKVDKLIDYRDIEYKQCTDFEIVNGQIKWLNSNWPGFQPELNKAAVYSIRYWYRPYFYCSRLLHEIRVAQIEGAEGRILQRMPQQAILSREYTFTNQLADPQSKDANSARQTPAPNDGGWGTGR